MPSFLEIEGYVFETEALKDAYHALPPASRATPAGYDEEVLRTLVKYFADWGPTRTTSRRDGPEDALNDLSADEKRALYKTFVTQLSRNLREQYGREADESEFRGFVHSLAGDSLPRPIATFMLRHLWRTSQRIHTYEQHFTEEEKESDHLNERTESDTLGEDGDSRSPHKFSEAIRRLPSEYLEAKHDQYEGDDKINGVRFRALQKIRSTDTLSLEQLQQYIEEENAKHETDIMQAYDEFTVLGQLYYDYFKPRIDAYLQAVSDYIIDELEIRESTAHLVSFIEPRNRLGEHTWFAIYPTEAEDKANAYQLFTGIHWDSVRYGLYDGDDLREEDWREQIDIDRITETYALTVDLLLEKFDDLLPNYYQINEISEQPTPEKPPTDIVETVARQLEHEGQVVFYGPPGTGKTFEAKRFAEWWVHNQTDGRPRDEQVESVTFHPSFSYEDFIEGLTADATTSGDVEYHVEDGILKRVAKNAQRAYEQAGGDAGDDDSQTEDAPPYILVIDEINRGNLAQIFGETITLLEADKRDSYEVSLAHSDESFTLPPNLYVIGTMNTADRSIALVDAALRRRFRFIPFPPDYAALREHHNFGSHAELLEQVTDGEDGFRTLLGLSILALEQLNDRIIDAPDLSKGQQIGHSYLWDVSSVSDLVDAWKYDILPLLEEYYFGQFDRIRRQLFDGTGDDLVDWESERIRAFDDKDLVTFLQEFVDIEGGIEYTSPTPTDSTSGSSSSSQTPEFPDFLQLIGEDLFERLGPTLQADSLEDMHGKDDFNRITLSLSSNHPDHPDDRVTYRVQPKPHVNANPPHLQTQLIIKDDQLRKRYAEEARRRLQKVDLPEDGLRYDNLYNENNTYPTAAFRWKTDGIDGDPHELDGKELYNEFGEELVEDAMDSFVDLVEKLHEMFVEGESETENE